MLKPLVIGDLVVNTPIIQGGMGVAISLSGLASAVANAGGIGVISAAGIGMTEPDFRKNFNEANQKALVKHIQNARSLTNGVIGVNLMVALSDYDNLLALSVEHNVDIVFMGAGLPLRLPDSILKKGFDNVHTKFAPIVSGAKAANLIFQSWDTKFNHIPDAIVVEGPKAGGHLGFKQTELEEGNIELSELIAETVEVVRKYETKYNKTVPIIAAGGIFTGDDIYNIMQTGASAVQMGTRFVATHECDANIAFKQRYVDSSEGDIILITSPVGLPGRVITSHFVESIKKGETRPVKCPWKCLKTCNFKNVPYCISEILHNAAQGKLNAGFAFAGTNAYRVNKIVSVTELMHELKMEYLNAEFKAAQALISA
jgi:nitronate monooxygenase